MLHLFLYEGFADFEITQLLLLFKEQPLVTVGFTNGLVKSYGNLQVNADISVDNLNTEEVEVFIIPGGEPKNFIRDQEYSEKIATLNEKLRKIKEQGSIIGAICGGPTFLAYAGLLDGINSTATIEDDEKTFYKNTLFKDSDIEISNNIVTAKGQAFTEFAVNIARKKGLLKDEKEMKEALNWFRNIKN